MQVWATLGNYGQLWGNSGMHLWANSRPCYKSVTDGQKDQWTDGLVDRLVTVENCIFSVRTIVVCVCVCVCVCVDDDGKDAHGSMVTTSHFI